MWWRSTGPEGARRSRCRTILSSARRGSPRCRPRIALILAVLAGAGVADPVDAQYRLTAPSGGVVEFEADRLLRFRDRSDSLMTDLVEDPHVLYFPSFGRDLDETEARDAWPWNAVEVVTDSSAALVMPGNLREAGRAYESYAVLRMHAVRQDPDVACEVLLAREVEAVDGFIDGWVAARLLFGGPAYEPLDELAFAREAGVLAGLILERSDRQLGGCLQVSRERRADEIAAYRAWRTERYLPPGGR